MAEETVGDVAELYLGNILFAIELAAVGLDGQGRRDDAAFYRGIARKLAEARGSGRDARSGQPEAQDSPARGAPRGTY